MSQYRYRKAREIALTLLACDSSDDTESSSDDEDYLLLDFVCLPKRKLRMRLNFEDLSNLECEEMFRLIYSYIRIVEPILASIIWKNLTTCIHLS